MKERVSAFAGSRTPISKMIIEELSERGTVEALDVVSDQNVSLRHAVEELAVQEKLNDSQRHACLDCVDHRLCLIQGPPGTGKTTCIKALIQIYARAGGLLGCTAPSHIATDNICRRVQGTLAALNLSWNVFMFVCGWFGILPLLCEMLYVVVWFSIV